MRVTLDAKQLFDEQHLVIKAESLQRDAVERAVGGLDGVLSIDLGSRSRKIYQKGTLRAVSKAALSQRISGISGLIDGKTHTLVTADGEVFDNLRMDSFKVRDERTSGGGVVVDYEIVYSQLKV